MFNLLTGARTEKTNLNVSRTRSDVKMPVF